MMLEEKTAPRAVGRGRWQMIHLNPAIVLSRMKQKPEAVCGELRSEPALLDVRMLRPQRGEFSPGYLYLTTWERLAAEPRLPACLVCVGGGEAARALCERSGVTALIYAGDTDILALLTELQDVFGAFQALHETFRSRLIAQFPMSEIIDACASFFENFLLLLDANGNVMETSAVYLAPGADEAARKQAADALTEKLVGSILRGEKQNRSAAPLLFRHAPAEGDVPEYCVAGFYDGNSCIGMLAVCGADRPLCPEAETLLRYAANLMAPCMMGRFSPAVRVYSFIRSAINAILENSSVNTSALVSALHTIGWSVKDDYRLVYIRMAYGSARNIHTTLTDYYLYENTFPDCIATKSVWSAVILVHNATEEVLRQSTEALRQLMTSHRMDCCISLPFGDFFELREHFELTRDALGMGGHRSNVFFYRDVMARHVVSEARKTFPVRALCHLSAVRIREYDRENGTNLLFTLEKYLLHNRSLQDAASELFIHRNTVDYRLRCIAKIVDLPLDSAHERLHLLASCIILRHLDEEEHPD